MSMELGSYTNFHELNQDWFLNEFNKVLKEWSEMKKSFKNLNDAFNDMKTYVQNYFKNLDVQEEINNKLDDMFNKGLLDKYFVYTINVKLYDVKENVDCSEQLQSLIDSVPNNTS